jgi:uncharacterized protein (TIGR02598 family)
MIIRKSPPNKGFSLVEIVVAIGVISFALVAIIGVLPIGLAAGRQATQETRANHLAEQIFSTLRSQPFTAAALSSLGSGTTVDLSTENGVFGTKLHATYDGQFVGTSDYFTIQLQFRNAPEGVVSGTASEVHVQISGRESGAARMDYVSIIGAN